MTSKKYKLSLFIFRRDLRLEDNTALIQAIENSEHVIPCFIVDPRQVRKENHFLSENAVQFMVESLQDLTGQLKRKHGKLYIFSGLAEKVVKQLIAEIDINAVFINRDYTPFSRERDASIKLICKKNKIDFYSFDDYLLNAPDSIKKKDGSPYTIFTPYYKNARLIKPHKPQQIPKTSFYFQAIKHDEGQALFKKILPHSNNNIHGNGGRSQATSLLKDLGRLKNYKHDHDYPAIETSGLSPHIKFGTVSMREVYYAIIDKLGHSHSLIRQLYWHDFFTSIAYYQPTIFGHPFHKKFEKLPWSKNSSHFKSWCEGRTGFPIVDAGMRQLNKTGFMHNRVRMIVASFLTKDLHIDWRWGEKYFAQQLVDYDPAINNGNWQWCASTGADAQPYFRIFNPWLQQKKFDPQCMYIKKWVPELKNISPRTIHSLFKSIETIKNYPSPIVDHEVEQAHTKASYRALAKRKK